MRWNGWLIWSNRHSAWWRANCCGYTQYVSGAGRYSLAEARSICRGSSRGLDRCWLDNDSEQIPDNVIVPSPELLIAAGADVDPVRELAIGGGQ